MNRSSLATAIGAAAGIGLFIATALLPALLYGGYAGVLCATALFGAPLEPGLLTRGLIGFTIIATVIGSAAIFAGAGAATAWAIRRLTSRAADRRATDTDGAR